MSILIWFRRWDPEQGWLDDYVSSIAYTIQGAKISIAKRAQSGYYIWTIDVQTDLEDEEQDAAVGIKVSQELKSWARERGYWPKPTRLPDLMPDGGFPDVKIKVQVRCDGCGRSVMAEVVRREEDGHGHEIWWARCPSCGAEIKAACIDIGREPTEYVVPLRDDHLAESLKHLYKLLQHVRHVLSEVEARLRELEGELRTSGVLMPDGGGPGCYTCSTQSSLELLKAHGLAGYLVIYDLPVGTPRWKLRRELNKLAEAGICFEPIQKSVLWCPSEGDAGAVAQAIQAIMPDGGKIEVFAVARMSWHDLIRASEHKKRELLARKLAELGIEVRPEDLHALTIADVDQLLRLKSEKLARALDRLGLSPGATRVAPKAPMSPLEAWARMDEEAARLQGATGVALEEPEMTPGQASQEHAPDGAGACSRVRAGGRRAPSS